MRWALMLIAIAVVGCGKKDVPPAGGGGAPLAVKNDAPEKKVYTREEFKALVMGKTQEEVLNLIGKPERTWGDDKSPFGISWRYLHIAKDPITDKTDDETDIVFEKGHVARIR